MVEAFVAREGVMRSRRGPVAGVVLAGGLSSRLGREKACLRLYGPDQPDLLERTHNLLAALLAECWVSCRPGLPRPGYACLFDRLQGLGPCGGVHAALHAAKDKGYAAVLVLPCDLPFMDEATLRKLLSAREAAESSRLLTTFRQKESALIEALVAIYEVQALPLFDAALAKGRRKLSAIVPAPLQERVLYSRQEALPFFNLNYPAELEQALRLLAGPQACGSS